MEKITVSLVYENDQLKVFVTPAEIGANMQLLDQMLLAAHDILKEMNTKRIVAATNGDVKELTKN